MLTEIGFRLAGGEQPLILVPASVNESAPYEFILDTGAGISLLTPELAAREGVVAIETKEGMGAGGKVTISLGFVESLAIGQSRIENVQIAITDELRKVGAVIGAQVEGNIGYNYLKSFRLTIDYQKQTLQLAPAAQESNEDESQAHASQKFKLAHPSKPLILLPVFVNDEGPYIFAVDTGASSTVVSPELASILGIQLTAIPHLTGAGGAIQASSGMVKSLAVGNARIENLAFATADFLNMLSQVVMTKIDGIIGYNFLKQFKVTIDYPNETFRLD
jgi:predicted aspartyl protease